LTSYPSPDDAVVVAYGDYGRAGPGLSNDRHARKIFDTICLEAQAGVHPARSTAGYRYQPIEVENRDAATRTAGTADGYRRIEDVFTTVREMNKG
jgi:hypothetical protein